MTDRSNSPEFEKTLAEFQAAQNYLFSLITDPTGSRYFEVKSTEVRRQEFEEQIERMRDFLAFAGNPQTTFNSIHVAGTSGKGSVVTMLASILRAAGIHAGHHVSPYVQVCNEKLVVNGQMISPGEFVSLVEEFKAIYKSWQQSNSGFEAIKYGEAWVALTYLWLVRQKVAWAVIETGLGGRYDPTNVLPSKVAVITNVDYDHVEVLGEDLRDIANHKTGIIKEGGIVVTGEQNQAVLNVIEDEARQKGAAVFRLGKEFDFKIKGGLLEVDGPHSKYRDLRIAMKGQFQPTNAAVAVAALDVLRESDQLPIDETTVRAGLAAAAYPGRMEVIQEEPVVILDGAHNRHKMEALAASLKAIYPGRKLTVVLGVLMIKDGGGMVRALAPLAEKWVATKPHVFGKPALPASELAEIVREVLPGIKVAVQEDVRTALEQVLGEAKEDEIIVVTGSIYLIGEARERWVSSEELLYRLEVGN